MLRRPHVCLFALLLVGPWSLARAQDAEPEEPPDFGTGAGAEILLTNNGFGLGGYFSIGLGEVTSLFVEASLGAGKDEQELKFFRGFGDGFVPNKRNYLLMLPVHFGIQQRLFREQIEDNFRPYFHLTGGPAVGWVYPYFDDRNANDVFDEDIDRRYDVLTAFPKGRARFGFGATVALGAYFGTSPRTSQGVRFGYTFTYFPDGIQLLEPDVKPPQQRFGSPVISITFGRLF
ncbi:MAG: hypothetical protein R3247_05580 [Rhodothermales bacterium]|nr:hypothetical protein [Rhodothermales bacterium]